MSGKDAETADRKETSYETVLDAIAQLINVIRAVPEFQLKSNMKDAIREIEHPHTNCKKKRRKIYLYKNLEKNGFVNVMNNLKISSTPVSTTQKDNDDVPEIYHIEQDRKMLLHRILLPLLSSLSQCYIEIDRQILISEETKHSQAGKKPPAPKGLLSLMNYTDIACLVEFTFCTGIIPHLEAHVLLSIQDRAKFLPRSFLGRLPRSSLSWGSEILQSFHQTEANYCTTQTKQQRLMSKIDFAIYEMEQVLITIFKLLMLDRFRPILFPRHTTDLYGSLFQLERLRCLRTSLGNNTGSISSINRNSKDLFEIESTLGISTSVDPRVNTPNIDVHSMAHAYQSILFSGRQAPQWLKVRVGNLLSTLAISNLTGLLAIIDIFVVAVSGLPNGEMSSASARLGKVLCTTPYHENREFYHSLLINLSEMLAFQDWTNEALSSNSNRFVACIYTAWAVLEQIPPLAKPYFYCNVVSGLFPASQEKNITPDISIRRVHSLLMFPPTTGNALTEFCIFLLSMTTTSLGDDVKDSTVFGQMIRLACAEGTVLCRSVTEAVDTLRMLIDIILENKIQLIRSAPSQKVLSVSLLQALRPTLLERSGYVFKRVLFSETATVILEKDTVSNDFLAAIENRVSLILNDIIGSRFEIEDGRDDNLAGLSSSIFQILLLIYFESSSASESSMIPDSFRAQLDTYKLITMIMLPLLCEKSSPALLFMPKNDPSGILKTIVLILKTSTDHLAMNDEHVQNELESLEDSTDAISFAKYDLLQSSISVVMNNTPSLIDDNTPMEIHNSVTEIVISMLIAILELGAKTRKIEDEKLLCSMLPYLKILATVQDASIRPRRLEENNERMVLSVSTAAIAEMSTHAMSLICSRSVADDSFTRMTALSESPQIDINCKIIECESQLRSDQVPTRARAVVELRKLVRGFLTDASSGSISQTNKQLIIEVNDKDPNLPDAKLHIIHTILRVSVKALDDPESYVYLACIQTISAIGDVCPEHTIMLLLNGITSGSLTFLSLPSLKLSPTQKVKMIQALIFIVRRRGLAVDRYAAMIINSILIGSLIAADYASFAQDAEILALIQNETHTYYDTEDDDFNDANEIRSERMIRFNTGGPVFDKEESDVIRSAFINLLSEVVSAVHPFQLAAYCPILVRLCINALTLDHSRLVRRSIALLVRELYDCVFREAEDNEGTKFILSFLSCDEEHLHATCLRCLASNDLDTNVGDSKTRAVRDKIRLYDQAVIARCKEAIHIRNQVQDLISAGKVILESKNRLNDSDTSRFLVKQLRN